MAYSCPSVQWGKTRNNTPGSCEGHVCWHVARVGSSEMTGQERLSFSPLPMLTILIQPALCALQQAGAPTSLGCVAALGKLIHI